MSDKKTGDILYAAEFNAKTDKTYVDTELAKKQDTIGTYNEEIQGLILNNNIKAIQFLSSKGFHIISAGSDITVDTANYSISWDTASQAIKIVFN